MRSNIDLSYLSDAILLSRFFEARDIARNVLSSVKRRISAHMHAKREFTLTNDEGLRVGEALSDFAGVLSGLPVCTGARTLLDARSHRGCASPAARAVTG